MKKSKKFPKSITVWISEEMNRFLEEKVQETKYSSTSHAVRYAIHLLMKSNS